MFSFFSKHIDCCSKTTLDSSKCNNILTRLRAGDNLCDTKQHINNIRKIIYNEFLNINQNGYTDEEHNTKYILKTLAESRESLKNLVSHPMLKIFLHFYQVQFKFVLFFLRRLWNKTILVKYVIGKSKTIESEFFYRE